MRHTRLVAQFIFRNVARRYSTGLIKHPQPLTDFPVSISFRFVFFVLFYFISFLLFPLLFFASLFPIDLSLTCVCVVKCTTCNIYVVVFPGWQSV